MGKGKAWDKNVIFKAVQLEAMGYRRREIAAMLNKTYNAVNSMLWLYEKGGYDDRLRDCSGSET